MHRPRQAGPEQIDIDGVTQLASDQARRRVSIGDMLAAMGDRATLMLTLLFALPNAVPALPGTSTILGLPLLFLTMQLAREKKPWVPRWIARQSIRRADFAIIVRRLTALCSWTAAVSCSRLSAFASESAIRLAGALGVLLSVILILPMPLVNVPIGIALVLMALAGLRRDGLMMALGMATGIGALAFSATVFIGLIRIGKHIFAMWSF